MTEKNIEYTIEPVYTEISYLSAVNFSKMLGAYRNIVYLHSAKLHNELAKYSYIGLDPFSIYLSNTTYLDNSENVLNEILKQLNRFKLKAVPKLPPFQGGLAGYLSYDLARNFEKLPNLALEDCPTPRIAVGIYDLVISLDHLSKQAWIISSGIPELEEDKRKQHAQRRLDWAAQEINQKYIVSNPTYKCLNLDAIQSNFTRDEYLKAVKKVMDYIRNGDIFEANLTQRFLCKLPKGLSPFQLFQQLLIYNPSPFAAFINIGNIIIASSSPERFIKIHNRTVETRPIKGTIRRGTTSDEDEKLAQQLLNSEKDNAENAMIVDLMRNDLSKICLPKTIEVEKLCGLESFETVHHLVSVIKGQLQSSINFIDILRATVPGGSITGAPKIRAMEIIDELEPTRRGAYCGNAFYYGFDGTFDSSILIRTFTIFQEEVRFQAGGAIVLDSDPEQEYEETLVKARPLIKTLTTPVKQIFDKAIL